MQRTFVECDRCTANLNHGIEAHKKREVMVLIDRDDEMKGDTAMVMCDDCYAKLLKFIGHYNPFTGEEFKKP